MEYSVALALEDFLPVIFSTVGLFFIARMICDMEARCMLMAYLGVAFTAIGGFGKASWKLIIALSGGQTDIRFLDDGLFFWLTSGFIFMTFAFWYAQKRFMKQEESKNIWLWPIIITALGVATGISLYNPDREVSRTWFFILLGMTTVFNIATLAMAMRQAKNQGQRLALVLFIVNLVAVFALQGLARAGDRNEAMQWVAQIINTLSQMGLAYGAWRLGQSTRQALDKTGKLASKMITASA